MYLLYADESGDPGSWKVQNHFVLGAVAVHEGQVFNLSKKMDAIQRKYFPDIQIPIALHATEIHEGKGHFDRLEPEQRRNLMVDVCKIIGGQRFPNLVSFATALHISALPRETLALDIVLADLSSRFNLFLKRQYDKGYPTKGLLIIDQAHTERYRELLDEYHTNGTKYGYIGNIIDIPYFAGARDTRLLQLADFCAYSTFRYYERNDRTYIDSIEPSFDRRGPKEPPDGLKHITKVACTCMACKWRS